MKFYPFYYYKLDFHRLFSSSLKNQTNVKVYFIDSLCALRRFAKCFIRMHRICVLKYDYLNKSSLKNDFEKKQND